MEDHPMIIWRALRALREEKQFFTGRHEKRTGLARCYISRVEHGYTSPNVETVEKLVVLLEVPLPTSSMKGLTRQSSEFF